MGEKGWGVINESEDMQVGLLFPKMKSYLKGTQNGGVKEVKKVVNAVLNGLTSEDYKECFELWEQHCHHCEELKRDYCEVPGLTGGKMSSSEEDSKIDLLDSPSNVKKKLKKAFCEPGNIADNGLLSFVKHVLFSLFKEGEGFTIERKEENGGNITFMKYEDLEKNFSEQLLHPGDLKGAVENYINKLLEPIRAAFDTPELKKLSLEAYPPPGKVNKKANDAVAEDGPHRLDIRVGKVLSAEKHPDADTLYVLQVDVAEETPRTVVSGLALFVSLEEMQGRLVALLCNLKPSKLKGVESKGMVLCTSNADHTQVEPILIPSSAVPGERLSFEGYSGTPDEQLNPKKKVWDKLQSDLKTNTQGQVVWKDSFLLTPREEKITSRLSDCHVK